MACVQKHNLCFDVKGRFESTRKVTLYKSLIRFKVREISIRPTTDTLREIGTVTKDSIPIAFKGVQVW